MALTIICVCGTSSTGKSSTIRAFTEQYLRYRKEKGDVRGVFQLPNRYYAVGVSSTGDHWQAVQDGLTFLNRFTGIRVMIVACHPQGETRDEVEQFAKKAKTKPLYVCTVKIAGDGRQKAAIAKNIRKIKRLMPPA